MRNIELENTRIKALRVIENIIILKTNVFNGCRADEKELNEQLPRLEKIKSWAKENNQLQEIKSWFASKNFGGHLQFSAREIASIFNK